MRVSRSVLFIPSEIEQSPSVGNDEAVWSFIFKVIVYQKEKSGLILLCSLIGKMLSEMRALGIEAIELIDSLKRDL